MASKPHVVIFPFMAQGHTIPLLDLSKVLCHRGLKITLITTPSNTASIRSHIAHYPNIHLREIPFPNVQGLPKGCENLSQLPSPDYLFPFLMATKQLQEPFERILKEISRDQDLPICVISDSFLAWSNASCHTFGIPRLTFHGIGVFPMVVKRSLSIYQTHKKVNSETEVLNVKGVQTRIPITRADLPRSLREMDGPIPQFFLEAIVSDLKSWGVIANSFLELESNYVASLESLCGDGIAKAWCVGPLLLYDQMEGGVPNGLYGASPSTVWARWLNQHHERKKSVLYVSFGSEAELSTNQLDELAYGLDQSGHNFILVVRSKTWNPPGNMDKGRGLVVREWVDQRWVLAHHAIGGFLSHCGWNSVLESLSMGVPILAWPIQAEQHLNAKFLAGELNMGLRVPNMTRDGKIVMREVICEAVKELMGEDRGKKARERAIELGRMAKRAVQAGGSSYESLNELIHQLSHMSSLKRE